MPKVKQTKVDESSYDFLRSYECHGLSFPSVSGDQLVGECPFCGRNKFHLNRLTGLWDCKTCSPEGGNLDIFFRRLWDMLLKNKNDYTTLAEDRGLLYPESCSKWGVVEGLDGTWLVPGFTNKGEVHQLYRYRRLEGENRMALLPTPNPEGKAHGIHRFLDNKSNGKVLIAEGVWDGIALSEIVDPNEYELWAVPGCNVFYPSWADLFADKEITFLYDNDYPDKNGRIPGLQGLKHAASVLARSPTPPASISYLKWGEEESYYDPSLPNRYDIRDHLRQGHTKLARKKFWAGLLDDIHPVPLEWLEKPSVNLTPSTCNTYKELRQAWRLAMHWPNEPGTGLDYGLIVLLATNLSTATQGEQCWIRLISPPSAGKSVLCEALSVARKYTRPLSNLTGLYSGFKTKDGEDNSLIAQLNGKMVVIKDGNTLQENKNRDIILSQLRDAYDGVCRSHYGNKMGKDYEGHRFTLVVGATNSSKMDHSGLGERFIDCIMIDSIDEDTEDEIGLRVALRAIAEVKTLVNGVPESLMTPQMIDAKRKTGGFVEYLRENADRILRRVKENENTVRVIQQWAVFTSFMRTMEPLDKGRGHPVIEVQRELSFRLTSQFLRMAICIAGVLGKESLDEQVLFIVRKLVLDTSKGPTLEVVQKLYEKDSEPLTLAIALNQETAKINKFLRFLRKIEVTRSYCPSRISKTMKWGLTGRIRRLYSTLYGQTPLTTR